MVANASEPRQRKSLGEKLRAIAEKRISRTIAQREKERRQEEEPFADWASKEIKGLRATLLKVVEADSRHTIMLDLNQALKDKIQKIKDHPGDRHHPAADVQIERLIEDTYRHFCAAGGGKIIADWCVKEEIDLKCEFSLSNGVIYCHISWGI